MIAKRPSPFPLLASASALTPPTTPPPAIGRRALGKLIGAVGLGLLTPSLRARAEDCALPARNPIEGPYFLGDPEERFETGSGLVVSGLVRDVVTCAPIASAVIVRWHANELGIYEEYYRAQMATKADGRYSLSTIAPGAYASLDPHIHWYVTAPGYRPVIAQIQWRRGSEIPAAATFDFALTRA
jgi:hypothetical protein